jgi:hypothetical protein
MNDEEFEGSYYETIVDIGSMPIRIKYESSDEDERDVDVQKIMVHKYGDLYIRGFCHLRNEFRTFAVDDRMIAVWRHGKEIPRERLVCEIIKDSPCLNEHGFIGLNFCFTGTLFSMRRKQAQEKIEALGGRVLDGLVDRIHFLVVGGKKQNGSYKIKAAVEYGVTVITEDRFLEFLMHPEIAQEEKTTGRKKKGFPPIASFSVFGITQYGSEYKPPEGPLEPKLTMKEKEELKITKDVTFDILFTYRGYNDNAKIIKLEKTYDGDFYLTGVSKRWGHEKRWRGQEMEALVINGIEINAVRFFQGIIDNTDEANYVLTNTAGNLADEALKD